MTIQLVTILSFLAFFSFLKVTLTADDGHHYDNQVMSWGKIGYSRYNLILDRDPEAYFISGIAIQECLNCFDHTDVYFTNGWDPMVFKLRTHHNRKMEFDYSYFQPFAGQTSAGSKNGKRLESKFISPVGITFNNEGSLLLADNGDNKIRRIYGFSDYVSTYLGDSKVQKVTSQISNFLKSKIWNSMKSQESLLSRPSDLVTGRDGSVYIADHGSGKIKRYFPWNKTLVDFAGSGKSISEDGVGKGASFHHPVGIAIDVDSNLYVTESFAHRIRKISPNGVVTTFAGTGRKGFKDGKANEAMFNFPTGIAVDPNGNVYVTDTFNHRIRLITTRGDVITFSGNSQGYVNGHRDEARFNRPSAIALDKIGNVFIIDNGNFVIRKVQSNGNFFDPLDFGIEGNEYFQNGDYEKALEKYNEAIKRNPKKSIYYSKRRLIYLREPRYHQEFITDIEASLKSNHNSVKTQFKLLNSVFQDSGFNEDLPLYLIEFLLECIRKVYNHAVLGQSYDVLDSIYNAYMMLRIMKSKKLKKENLMKTNRQAQTVIHEDEPVSSDPVEVPQEMLGPILLSIMMDPVKTKYKGTYDRRELLSIMDQRTFEFSDPLTRQSLHIDDLVEDTELKNLPCPHDNRDVFEELM